MGDLEELIFKQNVPGRYSKWDHEKEDFRDESDRVDDENNESRELSET